MNFLRNLIQGPGGGLGIPPAPENPEQQQEGEGPREPQVITQEHQQQHHITGFPTSLTSTSTPSVSPTNSPNKECDTGSVSEDNTTTTSTNYSSCIEVTTPSEEAPLPYNCVGGKIQESTTNSDSEYESAEEVDLPPDPAPSGDLQPVSSDKSPSCEANESETTRREVNVSDADFPGDQNTVISDPLEDIVLHKEEFIPQVSETLDINGEKTSVTIGTGVFTDCQPSSVIVDKDSHSVPQEQSENLPSVISDSVVTVTKSEIIEESISNKEVVIDECVTVSPNDIQLFEKVSEVVSPQSQYLENNIESDLTAPEANNISVCNFGDEASFQNISINREGGHKYEVQSFGETQDRSCDNHSDIQADSFPGDIVNNPETSVTAQGTEEREKSPLNQPITQDGTPEHLSPSEKEGRGIEDPQPPQHTEDPNDIPIPPSKGYNLDFLDNIDDPNFNPFATKTGVRSSPPPSPDPTCKLPPLKPAVRKKDKKTAPADSCKTVKQETEKNTDTETETEKHLVGEIDKGVSELQTVVSPAADNAKNNNFEEVVESGEAVKTLEITVDNPIKPPRKLGVKPNVINKNKTVAKAPLEQKSIEKNNNTVADEEVCDQENRSDPEELPLPPSKGYNLDFLDDLDDPNFNPFATKTAVRNSPPKGEFTTLNNKEEEPKPKVVSPKKTPSRKGFVGLKSKAKTPGCNKDTKSISNKLEDKKVSEASSGQQVENTKEEEEEVVAPSAGYNLDFLDDPNFDPFKTRSGVIPPITGSTKPSGVQENTSDIVKQQSIGSLNGNSNLELDVNENIDVEKESDVQKEKSNNAEELSETDSGKDFGKEVLDVCDHSNKHKVELTTEENCDVNDNSQPSVEKSGDEEETTNSEKVNLEKELERKRTYTLPEQEQFNVLENLESGLQIKVDSEVDKTIGVKNLSVISGSEENIHKVPTIGTIGQLDSLEFDQLLGHEASRLAEEFMNCSTDSGLPDSDESTPVKSVNSVMADTSCANTNLDENVNPFQKSSRLSRSPPLGKRGAVCGAESSDAVSRTDPFMTRRSLKRESVLGEERMETRSMDDDSGIALGSRSDFEETDANHSEAGPEIATGLTSSDLRCASQLQEEDREGEFSDHITDEEFLASEAFFKDATDLENQLRKTLVSPLLGR
ncbi:hypothetical protein Pmani_018978 [Petrolisthes manimaculis]|uniref:Uncharacterized protein n=1 Tax=Petrolisthes manimaculis TaxID=1843537 RepID=A0AAE1PKI2_9EUCA|nr:hypothetical protein Pmani_018978 [Petrolisthes manimaculis]